MIFSTMQCSVWRRLLSWRVYANPQERRTEGLAHQHSPIQRRSPGDPHKGIASWHSLSDPDQQHPASVREWRFTGTLRQVNQIVSPTNSSPCRCTIRPTPGNSSKGCISSRARSPSGRWPSDWGFRLQPFSGCWGAVPKTGLPCRTATTSGKPISDLIFLG
jgi:hypothetical protein